MKTLLGENLLPDCFCYDSEKYCISNIEMKIFLGETLLFLSV